MAKKNVHQHLTHDQMMNTNPDEPFVKSSMTRGEELHVESHAPYIKVFAALAVFTAIEYFYAHIFKDAFLVLVLGLMFWAIIKASMVGWYFMHLKFEGKLIWIIFLVPLSLCVLLTCALVPDVGRGRHTAFNDWVGMFMGTSGGEHSAQGGISGHE